MNTSNPTPAKNPTQAPSLYPDRPGFRPAQHVIVGGEILQNEPIEYNLGRKTAKLTVRNTGDRPIQVGSHFHFFEVNRYLEFDRNAAFGCHLNIPATTAIRFEPGDQKEVEVVAYSGKRRVIGFNGLVMGYTGDEDTPTYFPARMRALQRVRDCGFKDSPGGSSPASAAGRSVRDTTAGGSASAAAQSGETAAAKTSAEPAEPPAQHGRTAATGTGTKHSAKTDAAAQTGNTAAANARPANAQPNVDTKE